MILARKNRSVEKREYAVTEKLIDQRIVPEQRLCHVFQIRIQNIARPARAEPLTQMGKALQVTEKAGYLGRTRRKIAQVRSLTQAPLVAVGPLADKPAVDRLKNHGIRAFVEEGRDMRQGLDQVVEELVGNGEVAGRRGMVISVASPLPGSGTSSSLTSIRPGSRK